MRSGEGSLAVELLDRYLNAVAFWLPSRDGRDVVTELGEDIRSEIEAREDELGRPLEEADVEAILTRWGHPMRVAERYLPSRPLIGPALLPVYYLVLKIFGGVLSGWLAIIGVLAAVSPEWHPSGERLYDALDAVFTGSLSVFAIVTIVFAIAERSAGWARHLDTWTAADLTGSASRRDRRRISRGDAAFELLVGLVFFAWWTGLGTPPDSWRLNDQVTITWAPMPALYATVTALMVAGIAMSIVNLWKPRWTIQRLGLQMAMDSIALVVVLLILPLPLFSASPLEADAEKVAIAVRWVNATWTIGLSIAAIILTFSLYGSYRKLAPARRPAAL